MKNIGFALALTFISNFAQAERLDCRKVDTDVYGYPVDGAYMDPVKGIFISYIQGEGGGYELFEEQISAFGDGRFDRQTECSESRSQQASKTTFHFTCQSAAPSLNLNSILVYDSKRKSGLYEGTVAGGAPKKFLFVFSDCNK